MTSMFMLVSSVPGTGVSRTSGPLSVCNLLVRVFVHRLIFNVICDPLYVICVYPYINEPLFKQLDINSNHVIWFTPTQIFKSCDFIHSSRSTTRTHSLYRTPHPPFPLPDDENLSGKLESSICVLRSPSSRVWVCVCTFPDFHPFTYHDNFCMF